MKLAKTALILSAVALMALGCAEKKSNNQAGASGKGNNGKVRLLGCEQVLADLQGRTQSSTALKAKMDKDKKAIEDAASKNDELAARDQYQNSLSAGLKMVEDFLKSYSSDDMSCIDKDKKQKSIKGIKEERAQAAKAKTAYEAAIKENQEKIDALIKDGAERAKKPEAETPAQQAAPASAPAEAAPVNDSDEAQGNEGSEATGEEKNTRRIVI